MRISDWSSDVCSSDLCDKGGSRNDPKQNSLRLLPSGSDRVGENFARPTPAAPYGRRASRAQVLAKPSLPTLHIMRVSGHMDGKAFNRIGQVNLAREP